MTPVTIDLAVLERAFVALLLRRNQDRSATYRLMADDTCDELQFLIDSLRKQQPMFYTLYVFEYVDPLKPELWNRCFYSRLRDAEEARKDFINQGAKPVHFFDPPSGGSEVRPIYSVQVATTLDGVVEFANDYAKESRTT
jgi:hypothetical protein